MGVILVNVQKRRQNDNHRNFNDSKITTPPELCMPDTKSYQTTKKFNEQRIKKIHAKLLFKTTT